MNDKSGSFARILAIFSLAVTTAYFLGTLVGLSYILIPFIIDPFPLISILGIFNIIFFYFYKKGHSTDGYLKTILIVGIVDLLPLIIFVYLYYAFSDLRAATGGF